MKNIFEIRGKRGIAPLFLILMIILALIGIYIFLFLPFPAFTKIRMFVNYFLIIIFWVIIQVGLIFAYFKLGTFAVKGFTLIRTKIMTWSMKIKNLIITHT